MLKIGDSGYKIEIWKTLKKFIRISDDIYKQELRNLPDNISEYLMLLVSRSDSSLEQTLPPRNYEGSKGRFSDEVRYDLEVKIDAERSIDSHEKEFRFQRDTFVGEYLEFVDSVSRCDSIDHQNTTEIMNKLSYMTIDQINFISQN
jgi:hypothetical protein